MTSSAFARVTRVIARTEGDALWLVLVDTSDDGKTVTAEVRRQADAVAGTWSAVAKTGGVTDVAAVGGRLAVLGEAGDWQLLWQGGGIAGPTPPEGLTLRRFAGAGDTLWAIATRADASGELLSWSERAGWAIVAPLAADADVGTATLGVTEGVVRLAWTSRGAVRLARFDGKRWAEPIRPLARGVSAEFVDGSPRPVVAVRTGDGRVSLWRPDGVLPVELHEPLAVPVVASYVVVGPTLRIFSADGPTIQDVAVDDYGRGAASPPVPVATPSVPHGGRPSEFFNILVLAMLTVAMLRSMRSSESLPTLTAGLRPGPLWRRAGAALVDAVPLLGASAWVVLRFEGTPESLQNTPTTFFLPAYLGMMVYLAHVTAGEAWRGQSLGKWAFGLRVVSVDGSPASLGQILVRNLVRVLEISLMLIPCFLPLVTPAAQRLGDMAARTVVVARAKPAAEPAEPAAAE